MPNTTSNWSFEEDLEFILSETEEVFKGLQGGHIFLTGGTGFIGCWLLESLRHANQRLALDIKVTALTRNPLTFSQKAPHLAADTHFKFMSSDVCDFEYPSEAFSHVIHAATDASAQLNEENPIQMFNTVVHGTRHVLDFAADKKPEKFLFLSSGAIYGQQPWELEKVPETFLGAPNCLDAKAAYAEGKRAAEMMCAIYAKQKGLCISIARIFALLGPYLPIDTHFAAGNFIRDAMQGKSIVVQGNGLPCRSYLYASDLTVWLWHLLVRGQANKAYNVGSDESTTIKQLAERTSTVLAKGDYQILGASDSGWNLGRYVPDTQLINQELGLFKTVSLDDAIKRTALWHGWKGN
ncbi:MAG: NAD-dependent epimerase/dehydratase family protein [Methylococcaceae bacterium]